MSDEKRRAQSDMRAAFLAANEQHVLAIVKAAMANGAPVGELVVLVINVADPFGAPLARSIGRESGTDADALIANTPPDEIPTLRAVTSRQAVIANLGPHYPSLATKLRESPPKLWLLVADVGAPELFSVNFESLAPGGEA